MKYCKKCLLPSTKPYIIFNEEGVCNACIANEQKNRIQGGINWNNRKKDFETIVLTAKTKQNPYYDALVPVSGGKDSFTQIHRLLQYNVRILAVNVDYGIKTEIGHYNLTRIAEIANLMIYRPDLSLHKKLVRIGFEDFGDPDLLSHTLLHAFPLHVAQKFNIPLVLLGENSAFEYGGDKKVAKLNHITSEWFRNYAANSGYDAKYISKQYNIPIEELTLYDIPTDFEQSDIQAIFMSYYFFWDSLKHLSIAKQYGFKELNEPSEGTFRNYVGIDEKINRIHQFLKVLKFGYGRATDHACDDIRNGRIGREEAKKLVRQHDLQMLSDYYINDFIEFIGMAKQQFYDILESYYNQSIWKKNIKGDWYIPDHLNG